MITEAIIAATLATGTPKEPTKKESDSQPIYATLVEDIELKDEESE